MGMADARNYLAGILTKVGSEGLSVSNIPTGEDRIKLIFNSSVNSADLENLRDYIRSNAISGKKVEIETVHDQGSIYLVGQELTRPQTYTATIGRVATILASEGLSIREVISHEKSPSLALTVDGSHVARTIQILHREFVESAD
jgi:aspartokinase